MYILILYIAMGYGQTELKMQEFSSKKTCADALEWIKHAQIEYKNAECLPK